MLDQPASGMEGPDLLARPFASVLDHVRQCDFAKLVLRVYHQPFAQLQSPAHQNPAERVLRILTDSKRRRKLLWNAYERLDARQTAAEAAFLGPVDITESVKDIPRLDVTPISKGFTHRFPTEALDTVRSYDLDVLIRFGFNILRGEVLTLPRFGIWSYHHGDNDYYRGGPPHFWEMVEQNPQSGVILQVLSEKLDNGLVLCKGTAPTESTTMVSKNRLAPYLLGETFVIRKLNELHRKGCSDINEIALPPQPYKGKQKLYRAPSNRRMACFLAPYLIKKAIRKVYNRPVTRHWRLALRAGGLLNATKTDPKALDGFRWIESPRGRFWADPFLLERDGKVYCFFEDYNYATKCAYISCGQVTSDAGLTDIRPALIPNHHVSYPFVFDDTDGEAYMIPEAEKGGGVDLYRASRFPYEWEYVQRILDAPGLDTTIHKRDGKYWMFTTLREPALAAGQLVLLHADKITGPYQFHPENPISADANFSRCGGRIIERAGELIRPSQDACNGYGSVLHFRRITKFSLGEYAEEQLYTLRPLPGFAGLHHYDRAGRIEVIDSCKTELVSEFEEGAAPEASIRLKAGMETPS